MTPYGSVERGQVTVLALGLVLVVFAVAGLSVDGTRAFLVKRSLQNVADSSSLAGAGELDRTGSYASDGRGVVLDESRARRVAESWLALAGFEGKFEISVEDDGLRVALQDRVATTFLGLVGISHIPVAVESSAPVLPGRPSRR